jgi:hypothetical protein
MPQASSLRIALSVFKTDSLIVGSVPSAVPLKVFRLAFKMPLKYWIKIILN